MKEPEYTVYTSQQSVGVYYFFPNIAGNSKSWQLILFC